MTDAQRNYSVQDIVRAVGGKVSRDGREVRVNAPGHSKNSSAELSIRPDPSAPGGILVNCFSGEDPIAMKDWILSRLGAPAWEPKRPAQPHLRLVENIIAKQPKPFYDGHLTRDGYTLAATYDYAVADGVVAFQVLRYEHPTQSKTFIQRHPSPAGGWLSGRGDPMLYRLPGLLERPDAPVFFVEGEKDVDRLAALGLVATTVPNDAWPDDVSALAGRDVVVLPDNDDAGVKRAAKAVEKLRGTAASIRVLNLPGLGPKGDVTDWLEAGGDVPRLMSLVETVQPEAGNDNGASGYPGIVSSGEFIRGFVPPDYHIDGIAQSGYLYSTTAMTGTGKTAVLLLLSALTMLGAPLGEREVKKGRVVYFAGENPDDVRMRWIAMAHHLKFDPTTVDVHFIAGTFKVAEMFSRILADVERLGGADMIVVDTSAAYFDGGDENSNVELGRHARNLRMLTTLPGKPVVFAACHPVKNADPSNLLPRGGGAFIAEVDGNLTLNKSDGAVKMHWQGKHRGAEFEPVTFELSSVTAPMLKDSKGRDVPTVMARVMGAGDIARARDEVRRDEDVALMLIETDGKVSLADIADGAGWVNTKGETNRLRAQRAVDRLIKSKLVELTRTGRKLTTKGLEAVADVRSEASSRANIAAMVERSVSPTVSRYENRYGTD